MPCKLAFTPCDQSFMFLRLHLTGKTSYCGAENISHGHAKNMVLFFCDESRFARQSDSFQVFIWRERGARFHPSFVTKINRFGGKGILVWGCILLDNFTPMFVFYAGIANAQCYRDEVLEAYVRLFWIIWAQTTFLWTIIRSHTEPTLLMNFMRRIFDV
ncbi:transposable element Tcb2 transposase [Trichonephila clavipes]|uniref:Transposable element Tcb2 transposase n=1 Tax=Trichonephila clavipes TaxID=2585209 RepID=A0A8X6VYM5_TRICX|nr:transposable element Tcb2 transposase [Trichonephila clavipes]